MRTNSKILGAIAVAGVVAATGSAFTATSTIDDAAQHVGAVTQSITGVNVSAVAYEVAAADKTTGVTFHVLQDLAAEDVVTATIGNGTDSEPQPCTASNETAAGTDYTCSFTGVTNVTSLSIVVS